MPEFGRHGVHALGSLVPLAWLLGFAPWAWVEYFLVCGFALGVALEYLRLSGRAQWRIYDELTREYEQENPAGYFLYTVGFTVTGLVCPPLVAAPAMLMLALADPISGEVYAGGVGRKPLPVMALTFVVCLAIAVLCGVPTLAAGVGALLATLADGVTPVIRGYVVDDNLTIPLVAGFGMWAALAAGL